MGLCWQDDALLLVHHEMGDKALWAPPGGGVEYGETMDNALRREFLEETGLVVSPGKFLFGCEFLQEPLHAIELFFEVEQLSGELRSGTDPELPIIRSAQFLSPQQIRDIPANAIHGIFNLVTNPEKLCQLTGFYRI